MKFPFRHRPHLELLSSSKVAVSMTCNPVLLIILIAILATSNIFELCYNKLQSEVNKLQSEVIHQVSHTKVIHFV